MNTGTGSPWDVLLQGYRDFQHAASLSPGTIRLHGYQLADLAARYPRPAVITAAALLAVLATPGWSPNTRKSLRTTYRSFFGWAYRAGHLDANPAAELPPVRIPRRVPRPAPEDLWTSSLRVAEPREAFMIRLGAVAGLRCCEIARVHSSAWDGIRLRVIGKGDHERLVPVVDPDLRRDLDGVHGWAFPNRWTGEPITAGHVSKLLSRALEETWTGHTLRHRFGTRTLAETRDLVAVAEVMGHATLDTTRVYTLVADDRLLEVAAAAAVVA